MQRFLSGAGFARTCTALMCVAFAAGSAQAAGRAQQSPGSQRDAQPADRQLSLTVYNNNLMLVQDRRALDIPAGRSRVQLQDVSPGIRPETVSLSGQGLAVVEQNFDYDLLTPAKLMEKAVGHEIQVVRTTPGTGKQTTETATVLSVNNGVVLKIGNRIEVLRDDGIPARVVFGSIPENLRASPTLSVTVDAAEAGTRPVTLSYLATGLFWTADYVGTYDEKQGTIAIQGWITLKNRSGASFKDASTELIAGAINVTGGDQDYRQYTAGGVAGNAPAKPGTQRIADYYAYRLPERMTIANEQSKQVSFLDLKAAGAAKLYDYAAGDFSSLAEPAHAAVTVRFSNPGAALPQGTMRVYVRDEKGDPKFAGESAIDHTPAGSELLVKLGEAFDVTVQPSLVASEKTRSGTRYSMSYRLRNARGAPVSVELRQGGLLRDGAVVSESLAGRRLDAHTLGWSVAVPANGETVLTFTVDAGA